MPDARATVFDLIAGRWRSQAIHTGVKLGVFDALASDPISASTVAVECHLHPEMTYRLLRALASLGLMEEHPDRRFSPTEAGRLLRRDHPATLRDIVLLREGPEHVAVWKHLPAIVRDGVQNGFVREFGRTAFEHANREPAYGDAFDAGMSSYSRLQTEWTLDALDRRDFGAVGHFCDIGGGQGHLLCHFLLRYPHMRGTVLERPSALEDGAALWADRLGVSDRCRYIAGDMFADLPGADAYVLKMILHNWSDDECVRLLRNACERATPNGCLLIVEHVIPGIDTPHIAKLFDLHMMTWGPGRERTETEYADLLDRAGWEYVATWYPREGDIGVVEATRR